MLTPVLTQCKGTDQYGHIREEQLVSSAQLLASEYGTGWQ
jgi:hypothetical protein